MLDSSLKLSSVFPGERPSWFAKVTEGLWPSLPGGLPVPVPRVAYFFDMTAPNAERNGHFSAVKRYEKLLRIEMQQAIAFAFVVERIFNRRERVVPDDVIRFLEEADPGAPGGRGRSYG